MLRLLIPFVAGILCATYAPLPFPAYWGGLALLALIPLSFMRRKTPLWIYALCLHLALLALGQYVGQQEQQSRHPQHLSQNANGQRQQWMGTVVSMPVVKRKYVECTVALGKYYADSLWQPVEGRLKARFQKDTTSLRLRYGDVVLAQSRLDSTAPPPNPSAFDYSQYLARKGIYHETFVAENHARILESGKGQLLWRWSYGLRRKGMETLKEHLPTANELAVGWALILGNKAGMTASVKEGYARTGATHVLAVSGLHVGILFMVVSLFFRGLRRKRRWVASLELVISLLAIWGFVFVTGASPSVQRAATMFSFLAVGKAMNRHTNIYNTLAASAFLLLWLQPSMLFQPGFQLSYLAVLGIVYFQPIIFRSWYVAHPFGRRIWELMSVSLAAQLLTLPVSLYYFQQFPTYFLLSGLVVIPAAFGIMAGGLSLILLSQIPWLGFLSGLLGQALYGLIWITNSAIFVIGELPGSLLEGIYVSFPEMLMAYGCIGALMLWMGRADKRFLWAGLALLLLACSYRAYRAIAVAKQEEMVFYDSRSGLLIDHWAEGYRSTFRNMPAGGKDEAFAAEAHRLSTGHRAENGHALRTFGGGFFQLAEGRFFVIDSSYARPRGAGRIQVDGILIDGNPYLSFPAILQDFETDFFLASGKTYDSRVRLWRRLLEKEGGDIPIYHTQAGALLWTPSKAQGREEEWIAHGQE